VTKKEKAVRHERLFHWGNSGERIAIPINIGIAIRSHRNISFAKIFSVEN